MAQAARLPTREKQPRSWAEALGTHVDVELGCDRLRNRVRLLCGDTALLDRKRRDVAGRVDVSETGHAAMEIDRHRAVDRLRQSFEIHAPQPGECDHAIGLDPAIRYEPGSPSTNSAGEVPVRMSIPRSSSSCRTESLAAGPKSCSGSSSGVTSERSTH